MKLLFIAQRIIGLQNDIEKSLYDLEFTKSLFNIEKYKNSSTLKEEYQKQFAKLVEMKDEYDFYINQFECIENYFDVQLYDK